MIINGLEINYIDAQLKMACAAENSGNWRNANYHWLLAKGADEQLQAEIAEWNAFVEEYEAHIENDLEELEQLWNTTPSD
jgi:hypothetical protein